jgi:ligand-binding sensor domain-containing protein/serine phosphatase RsbU (regulator of sigma subunit)
MKTVFLFLFLGSICTTIFGQLHFNPTFHFLPAETFGVKQVGGVLWDKNGKAWMPTDKGIVCYNGYSSKIWSAHKGDKNAFLSNNVQAFYLDSHDWLWVSYTDERGITRFDTKTNKITHFLPDSLNKNAIPATRVVRFQEDSKKRFWILMWEGGLVRFDPEKGPIKIYTSNPKDPGDMHALPYNTVKAMTELKDGRFLMGFFGEGQDKARPHYFDSETGTFSLFPAAENTTGVEQKEKERILASLMIDHFIYVDKNENIWFGTYSGLVFFDMKNKTCRRISGVEFDHNIVNLDNARGYAIDKTSNALWVTTPNKGILIVDIDTKETGYLRNSTSNSGSIADNRILGAKADPDGNIWVSTAGGGYSIYFPVIQQFTLLPWSDMDLEYTFQSEQTVPVNQMLVRNKNEIYVSSENGLSIYNPATRALTSQIHKETQPGAKRKEKVTARIENFKFIDENRILIIHANNPEIYDVRTDKMRPAVVMDTAEKTWWQRHIFFRHTIAGNKFYTFRQWPSKIFEWDVNKNEISLFAVVDDYKAKDWASSLKIKDNFTAVLPSGKWMFPADYSSWTGPAAHFYVFDPVTGKSLLYGAKESDVFFPDSLINNVHVDPDKNVWILTENGMYKFDENAHTFEHYGKKTGLGTQPVKAMITDKHGIRWIALEKKIVRWDMKANKLLVFGSEMGMPQGSVLPSVAQMDDVGKIYLATMNGVLMFDPKKLNVPSARPKLCVDGLIVKDDTLPAQRLGEFAEGKMKFSWNENFLNIEISSSQVFAPGPHHVYYKLRGLDSTWQDNGISNRVRYTNLSYGEYVLEVKIKNIYGIESEILRIPFEIKRPFWKTWWFYLLVVVFVGALIRVYIRYREGVHRKAQEVLERKVEERTAEVVEKAKEISHQKDIIQEKNKELTDSIHYAERIQRSILPDNKTLNKNLPQHFVLFRPKDIVSGDFYWHTKQKDSILWAVVDCTGHGVPGGFMSMLGAGLLNQIVNEELKLQPDIVLNELRDRVIIALKQTGRIGESRDGMDISLCCYIPAEKKLKFAGANNSMYLLRKEELIEFAPDKQPIGIYVGDKRNFTLKEIEVEKDDVIYMTSDGYADQFGGEKGKKFKTANFEKLLKVVGAEPVQKQMERIENAFVKWKGDYEQLDDVCVFGVKI